MQDIKVTLIQANLVWENKQENLRNFENEISKFSPGDTDIVILPEMYTTGFTMNPIAFAELEEGETVQWMIKMAVNINACIVGSIVIKSGDYFFNQLVWVDNIGQIFRYNKKHLFGMGDEPKHYTAGNNQIRIDYKDWKINPIICYDLRFPVWLRNTDQYDLLICVANWPERRSHHWRALGLARAIENQCYVAMVNRVGEDGSGINHTGDSQVIDAAGNIVWYASQQPSIATVTLSAHHLELTRRHMPFLKDKDSFRLQS
ncbi:MAG: amidohydrolase [Bacteroidota bacterium]|nr:amidohydrolase [Bacteroidota bacterium]